MTPDYINYPTSTITVKTVEDLRPYIFLSLILEGQTLEELGLEWGRRGIALWTSPPAYMYRNSGLWHKKTTDGFPRLRMEANGELMIPARIGRDYYNYGLPSRVVLDWKPSGFDHPKQVVEKYSPTVHPSGWAGSPLGNF